MEVLILLSWRNLLKKILEYKYLFQIFCLIRFESLYHKESSEEPGSEKKATFFFHNKENQPFFLDYTYANFHAASYELQDFGRDFSDHVGQIVEI